METFHIKCGFSRGKAPFDLDQVDHMRTVWNEDGVFPKRKGGDVQGVSTGFLFSADLKEAFSLESGPLEVSSKKMYQMEFFC